MKQLEEEEPLLSRAERMERIQANFRPMTAEEIVSSNYNSATTYVVQLDELIHQLRQEAGLSQSKNAAYLDPDPSHRVDGSLRGRIGSRRRQLERWLATKFKH